MATSRPCARRRRAQASAARNPAPEASWSARISTRCAAGGRSICSRPEADASPRPAIGQAVITASPVSTPSDNASRSPVPSGASRTAPPAIRPSIILGLETGALRTSLFVFNDVGAVQPDHLAAAIAHLPQQGGIAGLRFPMRQIGVEQQIGLVRDGQCAPGEIGRGRRVRDRHRAREDMRDILRGIALGCRFRPRHLTRGRAGLNTRPLCPSKIRSRPESPVPSSIALIGPPPSFPSKSIQSPACGPRRAITQEPVLRGASPRILASRHSSPTRLPFGKRRGTQLSAVSRRRWTIRSRS